MTIKIFGPGCFKCQELVEKTEKALKDLGLNEIEVEKVSDIEKMTEAGIMGSPAIMIDEEIKAIGRVPDLEEIKDWLRQ